MTAQIKDSGLQFHPRKREILICDFKGNIVPEIVKKRPVVVLRDPLPYRSDLAIVVPLSSTPPKYDVPYCVLLSQNYLSQDDKPMYAKCDLACSVSLKRLDRIKVGVRKYVCPRMNEDDFANVVRGVGRAFGFVAGQAILIYYIITMYPGNWLARPNSSRNKAAPDNER